MHQKIKIIIILFVALLVMPLVYKAFSFGGPTTGQFEVQSSGFEILGMCPTEMPTVIPEAARMAAEKNMVGAMILCDSINGTNGDGAMPVLQRYSEIKVSCLPANDNGYFLYLAELRGLWTCGAVSPNQVR